MWGLITFGRKIFATYNFATSGFPVKIYTQRDSVLSCNLNSHNMLPMSASLWVHSWATYLDQSLPWVAPPHPHAWRSTSGGRRHADLWGSPGNKEWNQYNNVSLLAACVGQAWVGSLYHVPCWNARFCCCEHSHSLHDTGTYDVGIAVVSFMMVRESQ